MASGLLLCGVQLWGRSTDHKLNNTKLLLCVDEQTDGFIALFSYIRLHV